MTAQADPLPTRRPHPASRRLPAILLAAVAAGLLLRLDLGEPNGLWEDEIIAVTHAAQKLPWLFVAVLRHDVHPPLYFLQLHLWSLLGRSDLWFEANSLACGLAAIASLFLVLRARGGTLRGAAGAAFLAVLPSALWMSHEVRPYAWLSVLLIWAYAFAMRAFGRPGATRDKAVLLLLCAAIVWTHAVGFFAALLNGVFALCLLIGRRAPRREYAGWALVYGAAALASLPVLAIDMIHDANLGAPSDAWDLVMRMASQVTALDPQPGTRWAALAVYVAALGAGLALRRTRLAAACFLALPLLLATGVELAVKPIFKTNVFGTMAAPFLAIVLADMCLSLRGRLREAAAGSALAVLLALSAWGYANRQFSTDYLHAARDIRAEMRPGDVVAAPQQSMFWGMARYLVGPDWGSPLDVSAPPSPAWLGVYARLGPDLVRDLRLMPRTQTLDAPGGLRLMAGAASLEAAARAPRVWLVTYPRVDLPDGLPPETLGALHKAQQRLYGRMSVTLYD